ncbi:DEAD/DEAH box helicase family protein [Tamlana sp. 62-3]|uniref:DEAD/DEAH box helicase family protein n=1 Tax=Neotamlana sargassicola TaxID=2883125 RepID=A0A9X1I451_9FLAO|nr:DEAD/DEAH box helicase family protein [Tamlana sargassicola]MCB4807536.1 DEAD/DEAH box helicase family protein [Tamlana sargassicola]
MKEKNLPIEGIPIEYKKIKPEDFDCKYYEANHNVTLKPNEEGYISEGLLPVLEKDLEKKDTTIINAGVGQGKTRAILKMVSKFCAKSDYIVMIAVPYNSLVEQYVEECSQYVNKEEIFNLIKYSEVDSSNENRNWGYTSDEEMLPLSSKINRYSVHVMTVNALLGNPGDGNIFISRIRNEYFDLLKTHVSKSGKKIVWLFDEVHDSIHNFKENFIINLWHYYGLIHKAYIISATFNEASKEVIKYVSEFTDRNINIIDSERLAVPKKQSNLYLNFYSTRKIDREKKLVYLVRQLLKNNKPFDILVYSRSLAESIISANKAPSNVDTLGKILEGYKHRINRCYSNVFDEKANKKFKDGKSTINIGTNFSTGINIEEEGHTFIILLPMDLDLDYFNNKGVFTNGSNIIIQALARQRKKGNIHVFLSSPDTISEKSLPHKDIEIEKILECFKLYQKKYPKEVSYSDINAQNKILDNVYAKLLLNTKIARENIIKCNRTGLNRLLYPTEEIFKLNQGESYLNNDFFGGSLSVYVLWASITNQFLNCKLVDIDAVKTINFEKVNLFQEVRDWVRNEIQVINKLDKNFALFNSFSGFEKLQFVELFLNDFDIYIDNRRAKLVDRNKVFLMTLVEVFLSVENTNLAGAKKEMFQLYLRSCIYHSNVLERVEDSLKIRNIRCYEVFKKWNRFKTVLENDVILYKEKSKKLPSDPSEEFKQLFKDLDFKKDLEYLINKEFILGKDTFQFKNTITKAIQNKTLMNTFYKLTISVWYDSKLNQTTQMGKKVSYYNIIKSDMDNLPNLLYLPLSEETL